MYPEVSSGKTKTHDLMSDSSVFLVLKRDINESGGGGITCLSHAGHSQNDGVVELDSE